MIFFRIVVLYQNVFNSARGAPPSPVYHNELCEIRMPNKVTINKEIVQTGAEFELRFWLISVIYAIVNWIITKLPSFKIATFKGVLNDLVWGFLKKIGPSNKLNKISSMYFYFLNYISLKIFHPFIIGK